MIRPFTRPSPDMAWTSRGAPITSVTMVLLWTCPALAQTGTSSLSAVRAALEAKDGARAEVALAGLSEDDRQTLSEYLSYFSASAALLRAQPNDALARVKVVQKLSDGRENPLWAPAEALAAEALAALGKPAEASRKLLSLSDDGPRLLRAYELDRAAGGTGAAALRRLLVGAPETPEARDLTKYLGKKAIAALSRDDRAARVRKLLDTHQNEDAASEARLLIVEGANGKLRCELEFIEGKALRKLRKYRAALGSLSSARRICREAKDVDTELRADLLEAQVQNISRAPGALERIVASMIEKDARHPFIDDALFLLAESQEQRGLRDAALATYMRVVTDFPAGDMAPTAAWRLNLDAIKRGELAHAHERLVASLELGDDIARGRTRYWLARTYTGTSTSVACQLYTRAVEEPALTFYAFLAIDRLSRENPRCSSAITRRVTDGVRQMGSRPPAPPSIEASKPRERARRLGRAGFLALAEAELDLLDRETLARDEVVALALAYAEIEAHQKAQWLLRTRAGSLLRKLPNAENAWIWRTAYSRPFLPEIEDAAKKARVEPLLLQALSREESTFDPHIVSWAGAVGLAQLMPATAVGAYAELRLGRLDLARLTEPALNLRLGGHVLADGLREFKGSVPLALSAYNGGAGLTRRVLPPKETDLDLWVETIPVKETRGYVGRVSGTWGVYRLLYDPSSPFIDLPDRVPPS